MARSLVIDEQFCGPPGLGNGGYVAGRLARELDTPVGMSTEVTLRQGTPLGRALALADTADGIALRDGDYLIADARPRALALETPAPPSFEEAVRAPYAGFHHHSFPRCFGCGPERPEGDGLRVMPGPVSANLLAAAWVPDAAFADDDRRIRAEFVWAALDCPGGWAVIVEANPRVLLGRLTARIERPIHAGERCVVTAWRLGVDGRKRTAGSALYGADGRLAALALATWVELATPAAPGP
jgi:hypothetical protein